MYSSLDQTARHEQIGMFRNRVTRVLVVTDIAARGIDIPMLDYVVNYHFPSNSKLYVHRVGRVARAGRPGTAYSLVAPEELSYCADLHLFLGREMTFATAHPTCEGNSIGKVPQTIIDDGQEALTRYHFTDSVFEEQGQVAANGYKQYVKSRPIPSAEAVRRIKSLNTTEIAVHPMFRNKEDSVNKLGLLLKGIKNYKAQSTIFEVNSHTKANSSRIMRVKRGIHDGVISKRRKQPSNFPQNIVDEKKRVESSEVYVPYAPDRMHSEQGLRINESDFNSGVNNMTLDLTMDDARLMKKQTNKMKWDRKLKRFVRENSSNKPSEKKFKTESGTWIKSSYKTDKYKTWLDSNKTKASGSNTAASGSTSQPPQSRRGARRAKNILKRKDDIYRDRKKKMAHDVREKKRQRVNTKKRRQSKK